MASINHNELKYLNLVIAMPSDGFAPSDCQTNSRRRAGYRAGHVFSKIHHNDVIMGTMASRISSLTIVYSTIYSGADQRKHQSSASLAFVWGIHRGPVNSPPQRASNAENVSIWWRHHVFGHSWFRLLCSDDSVQNGRRNASRTLATSETILCIGSANERRRYNVTSSLNGWAHTDSRHLPS